MDNPYASPARASLRRDASIVRAISWPATLPQFTALATAVAVAWYVTSAATGMVIGAAAYLTYSLGSRALICRAHRKGVRHYRDQQYELAIEAHEASYDFFTRHRWIDQFRAIVLMSPSAMSYREMALCNIAFCYAQIGNGEEAIKYYRKALDEFPDSRLATEALRMMESVK